MSSSNDEVTCPKCGKTAIRVQDNNTCSSYVCCNYCGYDSSDNWEIEPNNDDESVFVGDNGFYDDDGDDYPERDWECSF